MGRKGRYETIEELAAARAVRRGIARHLEVRVEDVLPEHRLDRDLSLDPLDLVLIALRLEDGACDFPIEELERVGTVADLVELYRVWLAGRVVPRLRSTMRAQQFETSAQELAHARKSS